MCNSQSCKQPAVPWADERERGGNNLGSDEDGVEMCLPGGSVCLRNTGKVRKREAAEENFSTLGEGSGVLRAPHNYCPGISALHGATKCNN